MFIMVSTVLMFAFVFWGGGVCSYFKFFREDEGVTTMESVTESAKLLPGSRQHLPLCT